MALTCRPLRLTVERSTKPPLPLSSLGTEMFDTAPCFQLARPKITNGLDSTLLTTRSSWPSPLRSVAATIVSVLLVKLLLSIETPPCFCCRLASVSTPLSDVHCLLSVLPNTMVAKRGEDVLVVPTTRSARPSPLKSAAPTLCGPLTKPTPVVLTASAGNGARPACGSLPKTTLNCWLDAPPTPPSATNRSG